MYILGACCETNDDSVLGAFSGAPSGASRCTFGKPIGACLLATTCSST